MTRQKDRCIIHNNVMTYRCTVSETAMTKIRGSRNLKTYRKTTRTNRLPTGVVSIVQK